MTRSGETMGEAIALSSPSGRMSKRARERALERLRAQLFGVEGLQRPTPQPETTEQKIIGLRRIAKELRDLATHGMKPIAYTRKASEYELLASSLEDLQSKDEDKRNA